MTSHIKAKIGTENFREQVSEEGIWTYRHKRKARESCRKGRFMSFTHRQILLGDQSKEVFHGRACDIRGENKFLGRQRRRRNIILKRIQQRKYRMACA